MNNLCKGVLVSIVSLAVIFLLGELAVRIYLLRNTVYDVEMARYAILLKVDSANPLIGHLHKPNSRARLMGVDIAINSDGFRGKNCPITKTNAHRIIFLGDSLTLGWGVREESTFSNILQNDINKKYPVEIINFGTGNYNTEQEVNLFIQKGLKYSPDKVVVFYFINDAETTPQKSKLWFLGYSRLVTFYWSKVNAFKNNLVPGESFQSYYSGLYRDGSVGWLREKESFLRLREICSENNVRLQVVLLPELHNLTDYPFKEEYAKVANFLRESGIEYLDLTPFFMGQNDPVRLWVADDDAHPNAMVHQLIARHSLDFIAKK